MTKRWTRQTLVAHDRSKPRYEVIIDVGHGPRVARTVRAGSPRPAYQAVCETSPSQAQSAESAHGTDRAAGGRLEAIWKGGLGMP